MEYHRQLHRYIQLTRLWDVLYRICIEIRLATVAATFRTRGSSWRAFLIWLFFQPNRYEALRAVPGVRGSRGKGTGRGATPRPAAWQVITSARQLSASAGVDALFTRRWWRLVLSSGCPPSPSLCPHCPTSTAVPGSLEFICGQLADSERGTRVYDQKKQTTWQCC